MKTNDDIVRYSGNIVEDNLILTFLISNLQWEGLNYFKSFLSLLSIGDKDTQNYGLIKKTSSAFDDKGEFDIFEIIYEENKIILTGIVSKGKLKVDTQCFLGPDNEGHFNIVTIVNIHCKKISVTYANKGQYCTILIKASNGLKKEEVKKGMVLLGTSIPPKASKLFEVELWTIDGSKRTIKNTYEPCLNIKHVRQCAKIKKTMEIFMFENAENNLNKILEEEEMDLSKAETEIEECKNNYRNKVMLRKKGIIEADNMDKEEFILSSSTKTKIIFEFKFKPEYITVGSNVIIVDQSLKAFGIVTRIFK
ncbi:MAG: hypothetical protein MJ252_18960 [archaeon]|nr:hypothetical protein [archaeon]